MFEIADFYGYCRANQVDVIPYAGCPHAGATIRDGEDHAVFLDFSKIMSTRLLRGVCCHELGHLATGALHKVDSPYELAERSEYRANRYVAEHFLSREAFSQAFQDGCREIWELAEYFELPERDIQAALHYWTEIRGETFADK